MPIKRDRFIGHMVLARGQQGSNFFDNLSAFQPWRWGGGVSHKYCLLAFFSFWLFPFNMQIRFILVIIFVGEEV